MSTYEDVPCPRRAEPQPAVHPDIIDEFSRQLVEYVLVWQPYGGPPADDTFPRFGLHRHELAGRILRILERNPQLEASYTSQVIHAVSTLNGFVSGRCLIRTDDEQTCEAGKVRRSCRFDQSPCAVTESTATILKERISALSKGPESTSRDSAPASPPPVPVEDDRRDWPRRAHCRGMLTAIFYPPEGLRGSAAQRHIGEVKHICRQRVVRRECLLHALEKPEPYGIWGATTPQERLHSHALQTPLGRR